MFLNKSSDSKSLAGVRLYGFTAISEVVYIVREYDELEYIWDATMFELDKVCSPRADMNLNYSPFERDNSPKVLLDFI